VSNFDEALERFHLADFEYAGGLSSHGPMAAEALESLGHQALIPAFVDLYTPRLPPASSGKVLVAGELGAARGEFGRRADWVATFEARLEGGDWRELVRQVVPGLLSGLFAAAGHALLRTAHAVRGLERKDTPLRRRELARGLAYWEARYQTLPGTPGGQALQAGSGASLAEFFEGLPLVAEPRAREGLFVEAIARLDSFESFGDAIERAPTPGKGPGKAPGEGEDAGSYLAVLARVAASLYLAHPEVRIAYVHGVTLPVAMRVLAPLLAEEDARRGAGYALQAVAALHSLFGSRGQPAELEAGLEADLETDLETEVVQTAESWDEIRYRAACSIQEHAIKLAEACWREDRLAPARVLRLAAADAALKLEGQRSAGGC